jgi:hypothetical protein
MKVKSNPACSIMLAESASKQHGMTRHRSPASPASSSLNRCVGAFIVGHPSPAPAIDASLRHSLSQPANHRERARENPTWGYTRIRGALYNLGHEIGRNTIKRILRENGIDPAPLRNNGMSRESDYHRRAT